jgi:hypothetical protein
MKRTRAAWVIAIVGLLVYEAYTLVNRTPGDTLSEAVWDIIYDRPLIPFLMGMIIGHFVWQRNGRGE